MLQILESVLVTDTFAADFIRVEIATIRRKNLLGAFGRYGDIQLPTHGSISIKPIFSSGPILFVSYSASARPVPA